MIRYIVKIIIEPIGNKKDKITIVDNVESYSFDAEDLSLRDIYQRWQGILDKVMYDYDKK